MKSTREYSESSKKKYDVDRPNRVLTTKDREYLLGERELDRDEEYQQRHRIRKRVRESLTDLALFATHADLDDVSKVFEGLHPTGIDEYDEDLIYNFLYTVGLFADGVGPLEFVDFVELVVERQLLEESAFVGAFYDGKVSVTATSESIPFDEINYEQRRDENGNLPPKLQLALNIYRLNTEE